MAIRALIADDEALSRRLIHQLLERHDDVLIVGECTNGAETRDAIASSTLDVVFLDIRMPLQSGLDVARARDARTGPFIVFVTAFDKFALPAFDTDAVDYLTKPLTERRFDAALERVRERVRLRELAAREQPPQTTHLVSRVGARDIIVPLETVDYIQADDVYAVVHAAEKRYLVRTALEALEHDLDPAQFIRVHRSYIVRASRIREVRRAGAMVVVLETGAEIPVSRRRRAALDAVLKPLAR
jgi:two-component system LytT family response regulator